MYRVSHNYRYTFVSTIKQRKIGQIFRSSILIQPPLSAIQRHTRFSITVTILPAITRNASIRPFQQLARRADAVCRVIFVDLVLHDARDILNGFKLRQLPGYVPLS